MSQKVNFLNSQTVFFIGILFVLIIFLISVIFIFSQFFTNNSKEVSSVDNAKNVFLDKDFTVRKSPSSPSIDYNFKI